MKKSFDKDKASAILDSHQDEFFTGQQIYNWLLKHPDFIWQNPSLLLAGEVPRREFQSLSIEDFQKHLLDRFRHRLQASQTITRQILDVSRDITLMQGRVHEAILRLMAASDVVSLQEALQTDIPQLLELEAVAVLIASQELAVERQGLMRPLSQNDILTLMPRGKTVHLQDHIQGQASLYRERAGLVKSQALVSIQLSKTGHHHDSDPPSHLSINHEYPHSQVIIAFGARGADHFHPALATDLLVFMAKSIALALIPYYPVAASS